jgi:hypothetical protein
LAGLETRRAASDAASRPPASRPPASRPPVLGFLNALRTFDRKEGISLKREEFQILGELCDVVARLEQQTGTSPGRSVNSSSFNHRKIAAFADKVKRGELKGRERKRKANKLLLQVLRTLSDMV